MAVLAASTGLLDMLTLNFNSFTNGFAVRHLWFTDVRFHIELTTHTINQDVQVKLTHTGNNGLPGLFVSFYPEGWIFLSKFAQCNTHFFLVSLGFRLYSNRDYRFRKIHFLQSDDIINTAESLTGSNIFQTNSGRNIPRQHFLDFLTGVGMHLHHSANALFLGFQRVI